MIRIDITRAILDRAAILSQFDEIKRNAFSHYGALVRRRARQSIRQAPKNKKRIAGRAGKPPYNQTGLLKSSIEFNANESGAIVGPTYFSGQPKAPTIPRVLEEGGVVSRRGKPAVYVSPHPFMGPAFAAIPIDRVFENSRGV